MKKVYTGLLILGLLLISGCQRVTVTTEHLQLKNVACQNLGSSFVVPECSMRRPLKDCLSRDEAFALAIANNQTLQSQLQDIGVAKADLVQAGLYTNPLLAIVSNLPFQKLNVPNYSITTSFALADLWQTPLRKKIFHAQVQSAIYQMIQNILDLKVQVRKAYDAVVYAQNQLTPAQQAVKELMHDEAYTSIDAAKAQVDVEAAQVRVSTAFITLYTILGIDDFALQTKLCDTLEMVPPIPALEILCCWSQESRPEIANARWKIEQYKATVTYEKVRVVKDVNMGFSYAQDFTLNTGLGPEFDTHVPLFDQNQSAIARNQFLLEKSLREYEAVQLKIKAEVYQNYQTFISIAKQLDSYQHQIIPGYKALMLSKPQDDTVAKNLQESQSKLIDLYYNAHTVFADLERAVGREIAVKPKLVQNVSC
ncbi:TolC family protein [Candidatus Dependentiae bacterium]|nr:TolC family protein [Candidatus Dependentiae bacterium]